MKVEKQKNLTTCEVFCLNVVPMRERSNKRINCEAETRSSFRFTPMKRNANEIKIKSLVRQPGFSASWVEPNGENANKFNEHLELILDFMGVLEHEPELWDKLNSL